MKGCTLAIAIVGASCPLLAAADTVTVAGVALFDGIRRGGIEVSLCGRSDRVGCLDTDRTSEAGVYNLIATNVFGVPDELVVVYAGLQYGAKPVTVLIRPPGADRVCEGRADDLVLLSRPSSGASEPTLDEAADLLEADYLTAKSFTLAGRLELADADALFAKSVAAIASSIPDGQQPELFNRIAVRITDAGYDPPSREDLLRIAEESDENRPVDLALAVRAQIAADSALDPFDIQVGSGEGVVTLSGRVSSSHAREEVEELARNTDGVRDVRNLLMVEREGHGGE